MSTTRLQYQLELVLQNNWQVLTSQSTYLASLATFIIILSITEGLFWFILSITEGLRIYQNQSTDHLLYLMMVWRFPLLSISKKVTAPETFSKKKVKKLYIEPKKTIRSNHGMLVDFEAD